LVDTETLNSWFKEASEITLGEFEPFINKMISGLTAPEDISWVYIVGNTAVFNLIGKDETRKLSKDGFNFVRWNIVEAMFPEYTGCSMRIENYDYLLYPSYQNYFTKIPKVIFEAVQKKATGYLETEKELTEEAKNHLQSIVDGNVPFGFELSE